MSAARSPIAARSQRTPRSWGRGYLAYAIALRQDRACRACEVEIRAGSPALFRSWGVDVAHVTCGWLRADEREPHECRGAFAPRAWEWACSTCGRDVVRREVTIDRRCSACSEASP